MIIRAFALMGALAIALALFGEELGNFSWRLAAHRLDEEIGFVVPATEKDMRKYFHGKKAIVVGGTRGIGAGTAVALAQAGASVTVVGRSRPEKVLTRMKEVGAASEEEYTWEKADLVSVKGCLDLSDRLKSKGSKIDLLVMSESDQAVTSGFAFSRSLLLLLSLPS